MRIPLPLNFDPPKPLTIYDYQDISVVFSIDSVQSFLFNFTPIIPQGWRLQKTIISSNCSTFCFQNLRITLEKKQVSFSGKISQFSPEIEAVIDKFFLNYIKPRNQTTLLVFRRLVSIPGKSGVAGNFIRQTVLKFPEDRWQIRGQRPKKILLNFAYQLEGKKVTISLIDGDLKREKQQHSCLLFKGVAQPEGVADLMGVCHEYHRWFNQIVNKDFLGCV
ncbi:MAG TPA: hypothetical protein IGQ44_03640 [Geminocystis sp. M7585_C2015_104]|nr:hypothetical protein [Geminocystis sp. M7585_C2015_104]